MTKTTIQVKVNTRERIKGLGTMDDTYDTVLQRLMDFYEKERQKAYFVLTQHEIAKKGKFAELD